MTARSPLAEELESNAGTLRWLGIAMLVIGALAVLAPLAAGVAIAALVGALVLASGLVRLGFALRAGSLGRGVLAGLLGALGVACGVLMLAHPILGLAFLTLLMAAYFVVHGVFESVYALRLRPVKGWGWMLFSGITSLVLGALIQLQWPLSGAWAVGVLVGIQLWFGGSSLLALAAAARAPSASAGQAAT
jgi:uncharacterized membrane protein HdeD (DUF308 family)